MLGSYLKIMSLLMKCIPNLFIDFKDYSSRQKSVLSFLAIGIFVLLGFASIDERNPETKVLGDCEFFQTPVAVPQKCEITTYDENSKPPVGLIVQFVISEYAKANDNGFCTLVLKNTYTRNVTLGTSGIASFILNKSYYSDDDEIEIYFETSFPGYYGITRSYIINYFDPGIDLNIHLRKIDQYP
jgi:hypothetical protein